MLVIAAQSEVELMFLYDPTQGCHINELSVFRSHVMRGIT